MELSVVATVLGGFAVMMTAVNGVLQRRDSKKRDEKRDATEQGNKEFELAWALYKEQMANIQKDYADLKKDHDVLKVDFKAEKAKVEDLTHKHHICEEGRKQLEVQVEVLRLRLGDAGIPGGA